MFTYQKPLTDASGVPKLAFYANRQAFGEIWAASDNVDVVYGPSDTIRPVIFNLGVPCVADLAVLLKDREGKTVDSKRMEKIRVDGGGSVTRPGSFRFRPQQGDGVYFIEYRLVLHSSGDTPKESARNEP